MRMPLYPILIAGMIIILLVGCDRTPTTHTSELEFWKIQLRPLLDEYMQGMIARFQSLHPDIRIRWVDVPYEAFVQKFLSTLLDGSSHLRIWWQSMVPPVKPNLATLAVFTFVAVWGNFLRPMIVLKDPNMYKLTVKLNYMIRTFSANYRLMSAGSILAIVPVILLFFLMQLFFVQNLTAGACGADVNPKRR